MIILAATAAARHNIACLVDLIEDSPAEPPVN